jgi:hypothetical protein
VSLRRVSPAAHQDGGTGQSEADPTQGAFLVAVVGPAPGAYDNAHSTGRLTSTGRAKPHTRQ